MPRYYCDYCDTYLTHDSPSVRKQHNQGYKHKANVRNYYQQFEEQQTQSLIDQKVKEHLGQTAAFQHQLGATFALQSGQYRPPMSAPVLRPPSLPVPGSSSAGTAPPLLPTLRPPVLPRPAGTNPGYLPPSAITPPGGAAPQANGLPRPPPLTPSAPGVRPVTATSPTTANGSLSNPLTSGPPGVYQPPTLPGNSFGSYNYTAPPLGASAGGYPQQRPNVTTPAPNPNSGFTSQQPSRAAPPGTTAPGNFVYGQSPQGPPRPTSSTPSSYGPSPAGTPVGYRS